MSMQERQTAEKTRAETKSLSARRADRPVKARANGIRPGPASVPDRSPHPLGGQRARAVSAPPAHSPTVSTGLAPAQGPPSVCAVCHPSPLRSCPPLRLPVLRSGLRLRPGALPEVLFGLRLFLPLQGLFVLHFAHLAAPIVPIGGKNLYPGQRYSIIFLYNAAAVCYNFSIATGERKDDGP